MSLASSSSPPQTDANDAAEPTLPPVILSVFWCGTSGNKDFNMTQIEVFGHYCDAIDLTDMPHPIPMDGESNSEVHFKLRFDGCAVAFGTMGMLFGSGLSSQASVLKDIVTKMLSSRKRKVILNLLGLSRGAVACFIAAQKFKKFDPNFLEIHMLAFDPVPGNFVTSAKLDLFGITNAWGNMNLRKIPVLKTALLLYPYEPLPTTAVHAPMIPIFDPGVATYDVILGCHQGAVWNYGSIASHTRQLDTWISSSIIKNFLVSHGTRLDITNVDELYSSDDGALLEQIEFYHQNDQSTETRCTHSYGSEQILKVTGAQYLNKIHYILAAQRDNHTIGDAWQTKPYFYLNATPNDLATNLKFSKGKF